MAESSFNLAQFNISRLLAPLDDPVMHEFVSFLDPVNALAEQSPGFIWRMTAPDGGAASYIASPFEDPMMITNLTVWADLQSLKDFTYGTVHRYFLQSRRKWFDRVASRQVTVWWVESGHFPTLDEAMQKLTRLEEAGPSAAAFTFQDAFSPDGLPLPKAPRPDQP